MKDNIALVGFMGTGKSTVGRTLAKWLGKSFVEMDSMIEERAGKSIPRIFAEDGEIAFREMEMAVCKEISSMRDHVISCGGGVVLNKLNLDYLGISSVIICLDASPETIYKRIMADGPETRPLLAKPDPMAEIKRILDYRAPLYERATPNHVVTDGKTVDEIVQEIVSALESGRFR